MVTGFCIEIFYVDVIPFIYIKSVAIFTFIKLYIKLWLFLAVKYILCSISKSQIISLNYVKPRSPLSDWKDLSKKMCAGQAVKISHLCGVCNSLIRFMQRLIIYLTSCLKKLKYFSKYTEWFSCFFFFIEISFTESKLHLFKFSDQFSADSSGQ